MRRYTLRAIFILLSAALIGFLFLNLPTRVVALKNWKKFSRKSEAVSEAKSKLIEQELKSLDKHPWAGDYYYGDGLGMNVHLELAPQSGFVFTWHGCLGLYDLNYGDVVEKAGRIRLVFTFPNERKGFQGMASELMPVLWGERHYLIPSDGLVDFINQINAGFEPRNMLHGRFLLKRGDEVKKASGDPNIPSEYSEYLLRQPIETTISSVKGSRVEDSTRITTVVLNVGTAQGVKQGMEFWVFVPSRTYGVARITAAGSGSSEATMEEYESGEPHLPSPGWKLSTHVRQD
jgi:hypothetical protein